MRSWKQASDANYELFVCMFVIEFETRDIGNSREVFKDVSEKPRYLAK